MNKICVLGSINMDMVISVKRIPKAGETVFANDVKYFPGGKGSNQAVAAARLSSSVSMIGKVGNDTNGKRMLERLNEEGIEIEHIKIGEGLSTGLAIIYVEESGENNIGVISGANRKITRGDILEAKNKIAEADILISQFEVSMEAIEEAFKIAKDNNVLTVLNPAPANKISSKLLELTDIMIPNETEIESLTGINIDSGKKVLEAANILLEKGIKQVIVTLGDKGAYYIDSEFAQIIPAYEVKAVDTTAAGDSFVGAFCSKIDSRNLNRENILESIQYANKIASIVVQREGAQSSLPYIKEI